MANLNSKSKLSIGRIVLSDETGRQFKIDRDTNATVNGNWIDYLFDWYETEEE